ncbi:tRNA preQ1(34) S-adenosylmethionine ribosyltransferase-isomerase QueA [Candidatus Uhrbacteria bacterium]|nr:tRNA preQ1(34) S-adenosylmethionine ribosyltransferase-isomerase QueA [Candidatus Uhrbacteria bacterium]
MNTADFSYVLPPDRVAQTPAVPRDSSRLFVLDRKTGERQHVHFNDIGAFLRSGDLLVVNESKVFKARLRTTAGIEIFLLRPDGNRWIALAKPGKKIRTGSLLTFSDGTSASVLEKFEDGTVAIDFHKTPEDVFSWTDAVGEVPVPPYISKQHAVHGSRLSESSDYQTVYAKTIGSVAAPTAGFHFTPELIEQLTAHGVRFTSLTLHVGLGTFRPIKTDMLENHVMHEEWAAVPEETLAAIAETKKRGGRVIAVGTTTVRALESGVRHGFTNMFITPGYDFKVIDGLITNFHLPKSTLLVLVSAFAGRERILDCYQEAIREGYRFYSFGDAMLLL